MGLGIRLAAGDYISGSPFITFFPGVVVATFLGGRTAGLAAAVLGGIAAWYFLIPPTSSFGVNEIGNAVGLVLYFCISGLFALLIDTLIKIAEQNAGFHRAFEFHNPSAMANDRFEGFPLGGQFDAFFAMPVQDGGNQTLAAHTAALAGAGGLTGDNFKGIAHENSFREANHCAIPRRFRKPSCRKPLFLLEHHADRLVAVDPLDRLAEEAGD